MISRKSRQTNGQESKLQKNPAIILLRVCHLGLDLRHKHKIDTRPSVSAVEAKSAAL